MGNDTKGERIGESHNGGVKFRTRSYMGDMEVGQMRMRMKVHRYYRSML